MRDVLHEPDLTDADLDRLLGELALDGPQVPLVAMAGPRVVAASRPLLAIFGVADLAELGARLNRGDPGARRLMQLAVDMPAGGAPRLERLRFFFGHSAEPLTFLCRAMMRGGERLLAAAILNARTPAMPVAEAATAVMSDATPPLVPETNAHDALRARLLARFPAGRMRFVWRSDAAARVTAWAPVFAEIFGAAADPSGHCLPDAAALWGLDPDGRLRTAVRSGASWNVTGLPWPLAGEAAAIPVDLGAVPEIGPDGRPDGLNGFGIAHLDRLFAAPLRIDATPPAAPAAADLGSEQAVSPGDVASSDASTIPRADGATILPLRRSAAAGPDRPRSLSAAEQTAFQEIALLLAGAETDAPTPAPGVDAAVSQEAHDLRTVLDAQESGVLVVQHDRPVFANRALRRSLELADDADLAGGGGMSALLAAAAATGTATRRQTITWAGMAAELWTVLPTLESPAPPPRSESEARELAAILDTASDGVVLLDTGGHVLGINRTGEALFGYDRSEVLGQPFSILIAPDSRAAAAHYFEGRTGSGVKRLLNDGCEVVGLAKQGGSFPLFMTVSAFGDGERKFCALLRDMTHWRKVERDLDAARLEAERASAAKSDFLAKVSHEIRTPLNAIIGFAEVIMDERLGPVGNERYKDYLRDIHASGTHVMSLVNDLLDLSKIDAGKMELDFQPLDLNGVVTACISMMQVQANRERVIVRQSLTATLPRVKADERAVKQILLNLLSNALKFNEPGGQVIVATTQAEAGHAMIRIRDTGIGMTDAEIEVALEPFRTIASARPNTGTGLGLPLTKALVEANNALFAIKSRKGEGTLVEIAFPPA